ncbi:MAG: VOC family protein [Gammaproteobacteria bacterium]
MHRSRLAGFIIDCQDADARDAADFWGGALGMAVHEWPAEQGGRYVKLVDPAERLHVEVQSVEHASRVHLDIETDDIEAEVLRLETLGAKRVSKIRTWWVMEAPTGQRFCVVRPQSPHFDELANEWP